MEQNRNILQKYCDKLIQQRERLDSPILDSDSESIYDESLEKMIQFHWLLKMNLFLIVTMKTRFKLAADFKTQEVRY